MISPLPIPIHPQGADPLLPRLARRELDVPPTTLAVIIVLPILAASILVSAAIVIFRRRHRRRTYHNNSPTASAIRNSIEEDLESYRLERDRMGNVMGGPGVSQEDLQNQLRSASGRRSARGSMAASINSQSNPNSRDPSRVRSEIEGWYAPPAAPHSPRRGSRSSNGRLGHGGTGGGDGGGGGGNGNSGGKSRGRGPPITRVSSGPGSMPASGLRNSVRQGDEVDADGGAEKELRGFYEPDAHATTRDGRNPGGR